MLICSQIIEGECGPRREEDYSQKNIDICIYMKIISITNDVGIPMLVKLSKGNESVSGLAFIICR